MDEQKTKQKTISEMFEDIKEQMCDEYCRYTLAINNKTPYGERLMDEICIKCPLNRL